MRTWCVVGASVIGTAHQRTNAPCQDAHCFRVGDGWLALAIADGAGSASLSQEGAQLATQEAVNFMATWLSNRFPVIRPDFIELLSETIKSARLSILNLAEQKQQQVSQFATTISCAVVTETHVAVAQIGDGTIVCQDASGALLQVLRPERGEYANETRFITSADALSCAQIRVFKRRIVSLAALTDGLIRLACVLPDFHPFSNFFLPLFDFVRSRKDNNELTLSLQDFLSSDTICSRTDDDKTLVLAVRC